MAQLYVENGGNSLPYHHGFWGADTPQLSAAGSDRTSMVPSSWKNGKGWQDASMDII